MELNFEGLEMQKWNIPTDRAQIEDGKNMVICLFIMFTPQVIIIKISKMAHFCIFCWWQQKISLSLHKIFLIGFWATISKISTLEDTQFHYFLLTQKFSDISTLDISQTVTPKPMNHTIFWKDSKGSFRCTI